MTGTPEDRPGGDTGHERVPLGGEKLAAAISLAMWRQEVGDALAATVRALVEELIVTRAALAPVLPLDREVLDPAYRHLSSALSSLVRARRHLDAWQSGTEL